MPNQSSLPSTGANLVRTSWLPSTRRSAIAGSLIRYSTVTLSERPSPSGEKTSGVDRDQLRLGRRHVDLDRVREHDRAALPAEVDARPVLALGHDAAGVVAAIPAGLEQARRLGADPKQRADDVTLAVDDLQVDAVGLAQPKRDRRLCPLAVALGPDHPVDLRREDRAADELQALGDRERSGRAHEQGDDQRDREQAHGVAIVGSAWTRGTSDTSRNEVTRRRPLPRPGRGRLPRAAHQPGRRRARRRPRAHDRLVVGARPPRAPARGRSPLRSPLLPALPPLVRGAAAAVRRRRARGRAAAAIRERGRARRPRHGDARLRVRARDARRRPRRARGGARARRRGHRLLHGLRGVQARLPPPRPAVRRVARCRRSPGG